MATKTLEVFSNNDALDGYDCFVIELNVEYAVHLLQLIAAVDRLKVEVHDLIYMLRVWDYSGEYFPRDYDRDDDEIMPEPGAEASRTECCFALVSDDAVQWTALAKHTDCEVRTEPVMKKELEAIVKARQVEVKA